MTRDMRMRPRPREPHPKPRTWPPLTAAQRRLVAQVVDAMDQRAQTGRHAHDQEDQQ